MQAYDYDKLQYKYPFSEIKLNIFKFSAVTCMSIVKYFDPYYYYYYYYYY